MRRGTNVRVTIVFPGAVATNITTNSGVDIPVSPEMAEWRRGARSPADKAARIILDGMERDRLPRDGRQRRQADGPALPAQPARAAGFIANQMKSLLGT